MYNSAIAVLKGIRGEFGKKLRASVDSVVSPFITRVKSDSNDEDYIFFDTLPQIKEWIDDIAEEDFKDFKLNIPNKSWAYSIFVDRDTLSDSKKTLGGGVEMQVKSSVENWKDFPDQKFNDLLVANPTCFDGTAMFANTRPNLQGTNAIDNLYSGTSGGPYTLAQVEADLKGAREDLLGLRDRNGRPFNRGAKLTVYVPVHLVDWFETLRNSRQIYVSGTKDNILYNTFDIIVNYDQATTNDDWYIINTNSVVTPVIWQDRQAPNWDVEDVKTKKKIKYFSTARFGIGPANPMSIIKIDN